MIAIRVDLPEPDGPIRATNSPRWTVRSMPRNACTAVPLEPNTLVRPRVWMIARSVAGHRRFAPPSGVTRSRSSCSTSLVVIVLLDLLLRRVLEGDSLSALEAGEDLDALEGGDARGDGHDVVVVLPVVGEPDELAPAAEALLGVLDELWRETVLEPVDDGATVPALERFQGDGDRLVLLLPQDLHVRAHAGAVHVSELVERDLDRKDLDLLQELGRGRHEADFARERLLRVGVERDPHRLPHLHLGDVDLVEVDLDEQRAEVGEREEHGARVEGRHAGGDGLAELDALGDDDARHGSRDPGPLRVVARDRDAVALDDLVTLAGGLSGLGGHYPPGHQVL